MLFRRWCYAIAPNAHRLRCKGLRRDQAFPSIQAIVRVLILSFSDDKLRMNDLLGENINKSLIKNHSYDSI
jgi:hypothetical protein